MPLIDVWAFPVAVPVIPVATGAVHEYVVPIGTIVVGALFVGVTVNVDPLQIIVFWATIKGVGLTVTVTVKP